MAPKIDFKADQKLTYFIYPKVEETLRIVYPFFMIPRKLKVFLLLNASCPLEHKRWEWTDVQAKTFQTVCFWTWFMFSNCSEKLVGEIFFSMENQIRTLAFIILVFMSKLDYLLSCELSVFWLQCFWSGWGIGWFE